MKINTQAHPFTAFSPTSKKAIRIINLQLTTRKSMATFQAFDFQLPNDHATVLISHRSWKFTVRKEVRQGARHLKYPKTLGIFWESMPSTQFTSSWKTNWCVTVRHLHSKAAKIFFIKVYPVFKSVFFLKNVKLFLFSRFQHAIFLIF